MILIDKMEHVFATAASDLVKAARFVQHDVLPALKKVQADAATIEAVTSVVSPAAVNIERVAFAVLGLAIKAMDDANAVAGAGGTNLVLDAALIADLRSIAPAIQSAAAVAQASQAK